MVESFHNDAALNVAAPQLHYPNTVTDSVITPWKWTQKEIKGDKSPKCVN